MRTLLQRLNICTINFLIKFTDNDFDRKVLKDLRRETEIKNEIETFVALSQRQAKILEARRNAHK